jgi:aminoglycoside phosphotransferase (APT) family kinase protein
MEDRITALLRRVLQTNAPSFNISRVSDGVSTLVYRIQNGKDTLYLRMIEDKNEMVSPQIVAHEQLLKRDVRVPRFVSWDDMNATLGRSYMLVKEMPGISLEKLKNTDRAKYDACIQEVLLEAGEDLAKASTISTEGYGWIRRDKRKTKELVGELDSYKGFLLDKLPKQVKEMEAMGFKTFDDEGTERFKMLVYKYIDEERPVLAHGDFDMNHIYVNNGRYSGIIDWGDIRSASNLYDVAHFSAFHPEEEQYLLKGFKNIARLSKDYETKLLLTRIALCINKLHWIAKNQKGAFENHIFRKRIFEDITRLKDIK